ncbi:MAG: Toprim subdomain protein [archaeon]|nr:Toprim subdomain protein [archaeon]
MSKTERGTLTDRERLDAINEVLQRLEELSVDHILLIEGKKDRISLQSLGIEAEMYQIQSDGGPVDAAEYVEGHGGKAVVLTDWDRRGDSLAEQLSNVLGKDNASIDFQIRRDLSGLCRTYIKDVESLYTFVTVLSGKVYEQ